MTQLLHLVYGGELVDPQSTKFTNVDEIDIVGIFPDFASAHRAWQAKAQQTVDNAQVRYFIAHLHRLHDEQDPDSAEPEPETV